MVVICSFPQALWPDPAIFSAPLQFLPEGTEVPIQTQPGHSPLGPEIPSGSWDISGWSFLPHPCGNSTLQMRTADSFGKWQQAGRQRMFPLLVKSAPLGDHSQGKNANAITLGQVNVLPPGCSIGPTPLEWVELGSLVAGAESYGIFSIILFMVNFKVTQGLPWLVIIEESDTDRVFIGK